MTTHEYAELYINGQRMGGVRNVSYEDHAVAASASAPYRYSLDTGVAASFTVPRREWRRLLRTIPARCWKCRDGRTRSHHRRCPKRGNRSQASDALKRWMLERATAALKSSTTLDEARLAIAKAGREAMKPGRAAERFLKAVAKGYAAGRSVSRAWEAMSGPAGIMADVAGKAAGEAWTQAADVVRSSFLDSATPGWSDALYGVRREPATLENVEQEKP